MILFCVSGHGFGHATRTRAVMDALLVLRPSVVIAVHTIAPRFLFPEGVQYQSVGMDPPVFEAPDALSVDPQASLRALDRFLESVADLVDREARFVTESNVRLIVADIPFAAGLIAKKTGVPAVALGNFTWDWIFERLPDAGRAVAAVQDGYRRFDLALRFPLSQSTGWDVFPHTVQVPLVTPRSNRPRREIIAELGLTGETRPIILQGGRNRLPDEALRVIERSAADFAFLSSDALPDFHDLVRAADIVVSKLGYSLAAECIAEGKALLFPPRAGFREEEVLAASVPMYTRCLPIPTEDWRAGNWAPFLRTLLTLPTPSCVLPGGGAEACARILASLLEP
jgi:hypothetical protein